VGESSVAPDRCTLVGIQKSQRVQHLAGGRHRSTPSSRFHDAVQQPPPDASVRSVARVMYRLAIHAIYCTGVQHVGGCEASSLVPLPHDFQSLSDAYRWSASPVARHPEQPCLRWRLAYRDRKTWRCHLHPSTARQRRGIGPIPATRPL